MNGSGVYVRPTYLRVFERWNEIVNECQEEREDVRTKIKVRVSAVSSRDTIRVQLRTLHCLKAATFFRSRTVPCNS